MRSCDVIRELWEVRCEKWNCDELGCDKLQWVVMRSGPVRSGPVMSWDVISCDELWWEADLSEVELWGVLMSSGALCIAPATQGSVSVYGWLPGKRQPRASGGHRAVAPPGSSVYCACHAKGKCGGSVYCACQAKGSRGPAAATAPQLLKKALCTAPATQKGSTEALCTAPAAATAPQLLQKALCTAPATQKGSAKTLYVLRLQGKRQPRASGGHRAAARKLCVLRLPRKREVRRLCVLRLPGKRLCTAPATHKGSAEALCTAPARQKAAAGQRRPPRRSSARKLCVLRSSRKLYVLRLPRTREVRRLYVLRLQGKRQRASGGHRAAAPPGSSVYCACHAKGKCGGSVYGAGQAKGSRVYCACHGKGKCGGSMCCACQAKGTAPQLRQEALCTAPATEKGSAEALCTAPARQKAAAGQRRPPRRSSSRKLCALRLSRKRQPGSYLYSEWVRACVREWVSERASERASEWVSAWVSEWGGAAADGGERRDPSEKQEPHTVMWGKITG